MRRMLLPVLLMLLSMALGAAAVRADQEETTDRPSTHVWPQTAVLSPRRLPVMLQRPAGDRRLWTASISVLDRAPEQSCLIVSESGRRVVAAHPDRLLVPASNQKLLVAYAALELFGPERTLSTVVASSAPVGADGVVNGDLWIIGGGDPLLSTGDFHEGLGSDLARTDIALVAQAITDAGITRVTGQILGDDSRYDDELRVPTWPDRDFGTGTPGPLDALVVNRGFDTYATSPGEIVVPSPTSEPTLRAVDQIVAILGEGVVIEGGVGEGVAPPSLVEVGEVVSPPMTEIVAEMLTMSDNTVAELLVKEIGVSERGDGSTAGGLAAIEELLTDRGLFPEGTVLADGSGLHDQNRTRCDVFMEVLERSGPASALVEGLAVAGKTGTLAERYDETSLLVDALRAKTGSLAEATALSGYVDTIQGFEVAFVFISNAEAVTPEDTELQDELAGSLVLYPEGPPKSDLSPAEVSPDPPPLPSAAPRAGEEPVVPAFEGPGFGNPTGSEVDSTGG